MKIVHISSYDLVGGAARASFRLHQTLCELGHESSMYVCHRRSTDPKVVRFTPSKHFEERLRRRWRIERMRRKFEAYKNTRPYGYERFSDDRSEYYREMVEQIPPCDVVNLHWTAGFLDYTSFFAAVPARVPVVWTLHDMAPFTGGCHYDDGCERFRLGCGGCPQLGSTDINDLSAQVWRRKKRALEDVSPDRLKVVTPSHWLADVVGRETVLSKFPVFTISNGVDLNVFRPRDRAYARKSFNIPPNASVVLFVADSIDNRRKGMKLLLDALAHMKNYPNLLLLSVGGGDLQASSDLLRKHLGRVDDDTKLSEIYGAADVMVVPSLQENFGLTCIESLACGTPVVAFDVGGLREVVVPGLTGRVARMGDARALCDAVEQILKTRGQDSVARACRQLAENRFSAELQAQRYAELYASMVKH